MNYVETIEKINEILRENGIGISRICRMAGQRGNSAWYNALGKTDWNQLSTAQRIVIEKALEYIQSIKENIPDPTAQKAAEILKA